MLKRFEFVEQGPVSDARFDAGWHEWLAAWNAAPAAARPRRLADCRVVPVAGTTPRHTALEIAWFDDVEHLASAEAWLAGADRPGRADGAVLASDRAPVVAEEAIGRGADWLDARWVSGGARFKHMALAQRAAGLTPAQFSELWRSRAGTVKAAGSQAVVIPDEAKGLAYVQNHVLAECAGGYDAVNEVYFDDLAGLQQRIDWFAANLGAGETDLVSEHWFVAVRETPVDIT